MEHPFSHHVTIKLGMSLKVLINGPKGSGKSTLAKNIYKFHHPKDTWVIFDRGVAGEERHSPRVVSKKGDATQTYTLANPLLDVVLRIRRFLEVHRYFKVLEYFMFLVTPIYAYAQLNFSKTIDAKYLVNAQPLYLRNLKRLGSLAKIGALRKLMAWPFQYDFIVNVSIRSKEISKRLQIRKYAEALPYFVEFAREEINFQKYVLSKYSNVVNIDGYKPSYDLSSEFAVYTELVGTFYDVLAKTKQTYPETFFIERPNNIDTPEVTSYFETNIQPHVIELFGDSNTFVNYVLHSYHRQHIFVFTHVLSHNADFPLADELASLMVGVWGYLLWFDDVVDNAATRNNKASLAGVNTYNADAHFSRVKALSEELFGRNQTLWLSKAVSITKESMLKHGSLGFDAPYIDVVCNYLDRGYSYSVWPASILSRGLGFQDKFPLHKLNVYKHFGGQLINDIRDINLGNFDDIRVGQVTIPLLLLRDSCSSAERTKLSSLFGHVLGESEKSLLTSLFSKYNILQKTQHIANFYFAEALGIVDSSSVMEQSPIKIWLQERCKS